MPECDQTKETIANMKTNKEMSLPEKIQAFSIQEKLGAFIFITEHGSPEELQLTIAGNGGMESMCKFSKHLDYHINTQLKNHFEGSGYGTKGKVDEPRDNLEQRNKKPETGDRKVVGNGLQGEVQAEV